jgi:hypothetical protein
MANTKISALTTDAAPHRTNDYAPTYDASAVATKKVALRNFGMYILYAHLANVSPADATTYYFGSYTGLGLSTVDGNRRFFVPRTGIVTDGYITANTTGTLGSAETSTLYLRKNGTSDTVLINNFACSAALFAFGCQPALSVTAGDYLEIKWVTPTWATNPTGVYIQVQLTME